MTTNTTTRTKRSRISTFKQPFIAGLLTATSLAGCGTYPEPPEDGSICPTELPTDGDSCAGYDVALGCGDSCLGGFFVCNEDGVWNEQTVSCNPPPPPITDCPTEPPTEGESCLGYEVGVSCGIQCEEPVFRCDEDGVWSELLIGCNPPPPPLLAECPAELPESGDSCAEYEPGLTCMVTDPCSLEQGVVCGDAGEWEVAGPYVACNPPPPTENSDETDEGSGS